MTLRQLMLLAGTATLAATLSQGAAFAQTRHDYITTITTTVTTTITLATTGVARG